MTEEIQSNIQSNNYVRVWFQFLFMIITSSVLIFSLFYAIQNDVVIDPKPDFYPLTPQKLSEFGGNPGIVKVGLSIKDFPEFNLTKNSFVFSGQVSFEFDPSLISLDTLGKFYFEKGQLLYVSPPTTKLIQGKLFVKYDIRLKFNTDLYYEYFPLENHNLYLVFSNLSLSPTEVIFESSNNNFIVSDKIITSGWVQPDKKVVSGYTVAKLDNTDVSKNIYTSVLVFSIEYQRVTFRDAVTIFLPILLLFFMSMFCFSLEPKEYFSRISALNASTIAALLAYKFVIENISPKVGYFMLSDYIFFLILGAVCLIFVLSSIFMFYSEWCKRIICVALHTLVITGMVYLFFFWMV